MSQSGNEPAKTSTPELIAWMLGDNCDEKFVYMATSGLLKGDPPVYAAGVPSLLEALREFVPDEEMHAEDLGRVDASLMKVKCLWRHCSDLLAQHTVSMAKAVAILWSPAHSWLKPMVSSPNVIDRVFAGLSDFPIEDPGQLIGDREPLVRAAFISGHGPDCPTWLAIYAEGSESSPEVNSVAQEMMDVRRFEDPAWDGYVCSCRRLKPANEAARTAEREFRMPDNHDSIPSEDERERVRERFHGLSLLLDSLTENADLFYRGSPRQGLRLLMAVLDASLKLRKSCRDDGLRVGGYDDGYVLYHLSESIAGFVSRQSARQASPEDLRLAATMSSKLIESACIVFETDYPGDWAKRVAEALYAIANLHPTLAEEISREIDRCECEFLEWMKPAPTPGVWSLLKSYSRTESATAIQERTGILNFHQTMWLVEGERPTALKVEQREGQHIDRNWADQQDFEQFLPEAWEARRTDDWSIFAPLVKRLAAHAPNARFSGENYPLYNALNHLLLYAGDGQHPLGSLNEILSQDGEYPLLGGFSTAFIECWRPMLHDMWHWWSRSHFAPHNFGGTPREWIEPDFNFEDWESVSIDLADPMHLSTHCGAPLGLWSNQDSVDANSENVRLIQHEPTVVTVSSRNYSGWMKALRTMPTQGATIARVMISDDDSSDGVTLGFWLVQRLEPQLPHWRNHVRFLTDASAAPVLVLVRAWGWELPEHDDDTEA